MSITSIIHKQLIKMNVPLEIDEVQDMLVILGINTKDQDFIQVRRMEFNDDQSSTPIDHTISSGINKYIKDNHDIAKIGVLFVLRMFDGRSLNNIQHNILNKIGAKFPAKFSKVDNISSAKTKLMKYLTTFDNDEHLLIHHIDKFKLEKVNMMYIDCDVLDSSDDISVHSDEDDKDYNPDDETDSDSDIESSESSKSKSKSDSVEIDDSDSDIDEVNEFISESKSNVLDGTRKRKITEFFGRDDDKKNRTSPITEEVIPENIKKLFSKTHSKKWKINYK